jgi:L-threonylcarbamoyladenylate synthase
LELLEDDDAGWDRAIELWDAGALVAAPTDTVYGVAAPVSMPGVVARLFPLKQRDVSKPVAVLVADLDQAATMVELSPASRALAERFWPGALTIVAPRLSSFGVDLGGAGETVGIRCPDHARIIEACRRLGPLATTSANRSGRATPPDAAGVVNELGGTEVAAVIDAGRLAGNASTVVRMDVDGLTVLRAGPIDEGILTAAVAHLA